MTDPADAFELERTLFVERNVWFYQVPSEQVTSMAPRADAWDPEHPLLTGSVHVVQKGDACFVQLFEPKAEDAEASVDPTLFAQCPLQITRELHLDVYVHDCVDSSRYFMLRVEDEQSGRCAFVGIGFSDRTAAFNFKATLQDYAKYVQRQLNVQHVEAVETAEQTLFKRQDLRLPQGTTIRINFKNNVSVDGERKKKCCRSGEGGAVSPAKLPIIPPPPRDSTVKLKTEASPTVLAKSIATGDDEDWGDFTSA